MAVARQCGSVEGPAGSQTVCSHSLRILGSAPDRDPPPSHSPYCPLRRGGNRLSSFYMPSSLCPLWSWSDPSHHIFCVDETSLVFTCIL